MSTQNLIAVNDLHKQYIDGEGNRLEILRGVDLAVNSGDTVSIMGASGAGKSTLLHLIGALDQADSGAVRVDDVELSTLSSDECAQFRNQTIGFVFQFHHLLMDFNALENVMLPMWIKAGKTGDFGAKARELLDTVGISHRMRHRPGQLSGGEQQRLAIARALANQPRILLADEPTGNLDEKTGERVSTLLLRLNREHRLTMILVTHNAQFAAQMGRQYLLEGGRLRDRAPSSSING